MENHIEEKTGKSHSGGEIKGIETILLLKRETENSFKIILQDSFKKNEIALLSIHLRCTAKKEVFSSSKSFIYCIQNRKKNALLVFERI